MTIQAARASVGQSLGLIDFDGSVAAYAALGQAQQVQVADAVDVFINANPSLFTAAQYQIAAQRVKNPDHGQPLQDASYVATAVALPGAMLDSASNVLSGTQNALKNALYIASAVGIIFAIIYYAPRAKE